ncbi:MAG: phosphoenolpyruvate hydrolase family protein [Chloroflexota bacterium]
MTRDAITARLNARRAEGGAIVLAGVGSGITAAAAAAGGADLLATYGTAAYRMLGVPTALAFLPYDDANVLTLDILPTIVERAGAVPVIAGLGAHDPRRSIPRLVEAAAAMGASGVTNEPFVGIYGTALRVELEAAGYGFGREVALLQAAGREGLLTLGWAFDDEEVRRLAGAGVDIIGTMAGITGGGAGSAADDMRRLGAMVETARRERPGAIVLLHGGPLGNPATVGAALLATGADGYATGSSAERTPVFTAVKETVRAFRDLPLRG